MNAVHELPARVAESLHAAMEAEGKAATCDRDLAEYFAGRNLGTFASLCGGLATRHEDAVESLREAGAGSTTGCEPWLNDKARQFVLRVAGPRQLLAVALVNESAIAELYDHLDDAGAAEARSTTARLAERAHDAMRQVSIAMESVPAAPDWESLIAAGAVPALALGAERRLHRPR